MISIDWIHHLYSFIHRWTLSLSHVLAIVHNAAVRRGWRYPLEMMISCLLEIHSAAGLLDHMVVLFLVSRGTSIRFSTLAAPIYIPNKSVWRFLFFISSPTFVICVLFDGSYSDRCEVIPHCGFDLHITDFFFFVFLSFLGLHPWPMEVPRLRV